jgi:hypothetical protein
LAIEEQHSDRLLAEVTQANLLAALGRPDEIRRWITYLDLLHFQAIQVRS